jgi:diaminopimelate epimerase
LVDEREPLFQMCAGDHSSELVRRLCARHTGPGADGVVLYGLDERRATMRLFNADGSLSELSGNGLRCLAALGARQRHLTDGSVITVETYAGIRGAIHVSDRPGPSRGRSPTQYSRFR